MSIALATYRLQFHGAFRFDDARRVVPYLHDLGVTELYASPLFKARRGSTHGYDVSDPGRLNPVLGSSEDFAALNRERSRHGMGLLLDIVPNHMAASAENPWWLDVLENGPSSAYATYFDIQWHPSASVLENKILLPALGTYYVGVLEGRELALTLEEKGFFIRYYDKKFPLEPRSYGAVLKHVLSNRAGQVRNEPFLGVLEEVAAQVDALPPYTTLDRGEMRRRTTGSRAIKEKLWRLYSTEPGIKALVDSSLAAFNGEKGNPESFDLQDALLEEQVYRLAYWRKAGDEINYRRFFDIADLVGLRVEEPEVFESSHELLSQWVKEGIVTGVRVDHIDGLFDPRAYLERLQGALGKDQDPLAKFYVVVEKILGREEGLPENWPVAGTTGYEFIDAVNGVFLSPKGLKDLDGIYERCTAEAAGWHEIRTARKRQVLRDLFRSEMEALRSRLAHLAAGDRHGRDISSNDLARALLEVTAFLPVYRTYIRDFEVSPRDQQLLDQALSAALAANPDVAAEAFDFVRRVLLLSFPESLAAGPRREWLRFVMEWQQLTGPVMAKGFEDTTLYVYNRLVSMNEVGCDPDPVDSPVRYFHQWNRRRLKAHPCSLNATSTHDTKRGEDFRARVHVLSEMAEAWGRCLARWRKFNENKKLSVAGRPVPDANEEYLIYQTLIGAWPLDKKEIPAFGERLKAYLVKAAREAKTHSSWLNPDQDYEKALAGFAKRLVRSSGGNRFMADFLKFQRKIAGYGAIYSLAQVLIKIVSPGVPDFYQGTELWDLTLVDPDNRRAVDYEKRIRYLGDIKKREAEDLQGLLKELMSHWEDGRIKLFLTAKGLNFRKNHPELFLAGEYLPLGATGKRRECLLALARRKGNSWVIALVPRLVVELVPVGEFPLGTKAWGKSAVLLPNQAPETWHNVLTGENIKVNRVGGKKALPVHQVLGRFPVALLSGI